MFCKRALTKWWRENVWNRQTSPTGEEKCNCNKRIKQLAEEIDITC